jgi:hypothetical protein
MSVYGLKCTAIDEYAVVEIPIVGVAGSVRSDDSELDGAQRQAMHKETTWSHV